MTHFSAHIHTPSSTLESSASEINFAFLALSLIIYYIISALLMATLLMCKKFLNHCSLPVMSKKKKGGGFFHPKSATVHSATSHAKQVFHVKNTWGRYGVTQEQAQMSKHPPCDVEVYVLPWSWFPL